MYTYKANVINVVDGDTVDASISLGFDIAQTMRLRLSDVNTPERGQPGYAMAKQRVASWVSANPVCIVTTQKDRREKYGRYLATLTPLAGGLSLNQILLDEKLAKPYEGKGPKE